MTTAVARSGRWIPVERSCAAAPHMRWYIPTGGVMSVNAMPNSQRDEGVRTMVVLMEIPQNRIWQPSACVVRSRRLAR